MRSFPTSLSQPMPNHLVKVLAMVIVLACACGNAQSRAADPSDDGTLAAAQNSPAYKFVKVWKLALPLHAEYRTIAMMFYIPPLSPVVSTIEEGLIRLDISPERIDFELMIIENTGYPGYFLIVEDFITDSLNFVR